MLTSGFHKWFKKQQLVSPGAGSPRVLQGLADHFIAVLGLGLLATKLRELVLRKTGRSEKLVL